MESTTLLVLARTLAVAAAALAVGIGPAHLQIRKVHGLLRSVRRTTSPTWSPTITRD